MRLDGKKAELLRLHNEERVEHGAPTLCVHPQLKAAQAHAEDMLKRGFYEHVIPGIQQRALSALDGLFS